MSHRINIYNNVKPSEAEDSDLMMVEWGYDVPLLLQTLFIDGGFVAANLYNNHTEPNNFGLYYNAKPGIDNLKKFYEFLEKHQADLIDDFDKFIAAKTQLFNFLDKLKQPFFHVDAWDVFNMNDESHESQAKQLLIDIQKNNDVITKAVETDDVALLDISLFAREAQVGFNSFKDLLNYVDYDYGWEHIWQEYVEPNQGEIFEENGLWGYKNDDGEILIKPAYDEFFGFDNSCDLAVVGKNKKYGYVNKLGVEITPLIFDDAFDFEYCESGIVMVGDKFGLVNLNGKIILEPNYEDIRSIDYKENFSAKLGGKYGLITSSGEVKIDFISTNPFEYSSGNFFTKVDGQKASKIYTSNFTYIGDYPISALEDLSYNNLLVKPHKNQQKHKIFDSKGNLLVDEFDKIIKSGYVCYFLIMHKNKKRGVFDLATSTLILDFEYDKIEVLALPLVYAGANSLKIEKDGLLGILDVEHPEKWVVELGNYDDAMFLSNTIYALKRGKLWALKYLVEDEPLNFELDLVCRTIVYASVVLGYAFLGNDVYSISEEGLEYANAYEVLEHVNDPLSVYYFDDYARKKLVAFINREIGELPG